MTLRDRNIPAITLRHMHRAERAGGAECKGELSPGFQLGGKVFSLDIPSYRTICSGPRTISIAHWLVNTHVTAADPTLN
jgi:hypothetical protein